MSAKVADVFAAQQSERTSLWADFSWTCMGNAIYAAGQFAMLVLLTKLVRPELVGQYALGLALVYPVMMLTNMQLRSVMISDHRRQSHFGHYLGLRLLATVVALAIIFATTQVLRYRWELTAVVLLVAVAYGVETISDMYYARLQLHDRMAEISKSLIARALLSVFGLGVAVYFSRSLLWGVMAIVLARTAVLFGYDICERTHGIGEKSKWFSANQTMAPRFELGKQLELLWRSLPLGIVVLLTTLNASIPIFFIKHGLGERDLGIFSALGLTISIGNMAVVSLGQAAFTRLSRAYASRRFATFGSLLGKLLIFAAAIGVCGMIISKLAGREILTSLFRPEYAERADLLPWMMAAGAILFMAQFLGYGMTAAGVYHSQVILNVLGNVSLMAACYWLVGRQGLLGAILAMLIAAIVQFVASAIILCRACVRTPMERTQESEVVAMPPAAYPFRRIGEDSQ